MGCGLPGIGRLQQHRVLVEAPQPRVLHRVRVLLLREVVVLELVELVHVDWYVVERNVPGTDDALEHEEPEALGRGEGQPFDGCDSSPPTSLSSSRLVLEELVPRVVGRRVSEDVLRYPVVDLHGVGELLPVGLEPDVERGPPRGELALPDELALSLGDLRVSLVAAPIDDCSPISVPVALVVDGVLAATRRRDLGHVEPPAVLADGGVRKTVSYFSWPVSSLIFLPYGLRVGEDLRSDR